MSILSAVFLITGYDSFVKIASHYLVYCCLDTVNHSNVTKWVCAITNC